MIDHTKTKQVFVGGTAVEADPLVYFYDDYLSDHECERIIELARPKLERATVVAEDGNEISDVRTNDYMFLKHNVDPVICEVVNRVAELVELPANNAEDLQVVHYDEGQEYKPHQDAFDPNQPEYKQFLGKSGQRVMTALMYLNDVAKGGGTGFPHLDAEIRPRKGRIVIFQTCVYGTKEPNPKSLHGGLPVGENQTKWAANLWFREGMFQQPDPDDHVYTRVFD